MRNLILIILILFVNFTNSQEKSDAELLLNKVSETLIAADSLLSFVFALNAQPKIAIFLPVKVPSK